MAQAGLRRLHGGQSPDVGALRTPRDSSHPRVDRPEVGDVGVTANFLEDEMAKDSMIRRHERGPQRRMAEWLDRSVWADLVNWPGFGLLRDGDNMLRIEEYRDDDTFVVRTEMPGIDPDKDVQIEMRDHTLEIRAEHREERTDEDKETRRSEFRYGSFFRAVPLPVEAKEGDVKATYKDGVLEVRVPCAPSFEERPHRIPVERK